VNDLSQSLLFSNSLLPIAGRAVAFSLHPLPAERRSPSDFSGGQGTDEYGGIPLRPPNSFSPKQEAIVHEHEQGFEMSLVF
jgi:hypothetical protein